jgi:hypothetical protein
VLLLLLLLLLLFKEMSLLLQRLRRWWLHWVKQGLEEGKVTHSSTLPIFSPPPTSAHLLRHQCLLLLGKGLLLGLSMRLLLQQWWLCGGGLGMSMGSRRHMLSRCRDCW